MSRSVSIVDGNFTDHRYHECRVDIKTQAKHMVSLEIFQYEHPGSRTTIIRQIRINNNSIRVCRIARRFVLS